MLWAVGIVAALLLFYYFLIKPQQYWSERNVKQGIPIPLFGDHLGLVFRQETMSAIIKRLYNKFKGERYFGLYQTTVPSLVICDLDLIKQITVKDFDHFVDHRQFTQENLEPLWSKNLFSLKGDKWREMRATLSPAFTTSKMRAMFDLMEKSAKQYIDFYWNKNQKVLDIELKDSFSRFATDVIANCAFGITVDSLKNPKNEFYTKGKDITTFSGLSWQNIRFLLNLVAPNFAAFFKIGWFSADISKFFQNLIHEAVKTREEQNIIRPDIIHCLMEARKGRLQYEESSEQKDTGFATVEELEVDKEKTFKKQALTEIDMAAQVLIFTFAGFDTISTMMSFMCYELAVHPEIQEKLRDEIDEASRKCNGVLTYDVLNKLKYMDMVISECMRKDAAAVITERVCTKSYTIQPEHRHETPVHLKPGDAIILPICEILQDEEYFPNPTKFDPERFSNEYRDKIKPFSYLPFGCGPRNCIGSRFALMECKTLVFHILRKFELVVIDKTTVPMKLSKRHIFPYLQGGFWVGLKRRDNC